MREKGGRFWYRTIHSLSLFIDVIYPADRFFSINLKGKVRGGKKEVEE